MMSRDRIARILAAILLLGVLALGVARNSAGPLPDDPQSTVYSMLAAARAGDVERYLGYFTAPALDQLRQTVRENGTAAFSAYLRKSNASIEGVAIADPELAGELAQLRVECIYQDHNSTQQLNLTKSGGRWQIANADTEALTQMPVRYGTSMR